MWRWLLALLLTALSLTVFASPSSVGPASPKEAEILWKDGQAAFSARDHQRAANLLQRLTDRYPGFAGYLESHYLLGISRLELGEPQRAIMPLRQYIETKTRARDAQSRHEGLQARVALATAYLESGKPAEALLVSNEALDLSRPNDEPSFDRAAGIRALQRKARALIALHRDTDALNALQSSRDALARLPGGGEDPALRAETPRLELMLKTRACAKFASERRIGEEALRDQLTRRGDCLAEALLSYRELLAQGDTASSSSAGSELGNSFGEYLRVCVTPPPPAGKRTPRQLRQYRAELASLLRQDCQTQIAHSISLIQQWKASLKPEASGPMQELLRALQELKGGS